MSFQLQRAWVWTTLAALVSIGSVVQLSAGPKPGGDRERDESRIRHVLLLSIDGMHALDFETCVAAGTCPHLAELREHGVTYTRTSAAKPSDSFPGLMALVTGGTPKTVGAYYDVAYDRVLAPPASDTGNGLLHGPCVPGVVNGTRIEYEEGVDIDQSLLNGGGPYSTFDGGFLSIDPKKLPRDQFSRPSPCAPLYPWNFIRTNTIYGVIHKAGGRTAWADKHAVYAVVSGPTGTSLPSNVDDYYSPDVNSDVIALPGVHTAPGLDCSAIPDPNGGDWTTSFKNIECYDQLKVNAVLNWIQGRTHLGGGRAPVPAIFGMNFQAVSVGQKLIENGNNGGYTDAAGTPTANMLMEIRFVDAAIGQMVEELQDRGLPTRPRLSSPPNMASHRLTRIGSSRFPATAGRTAHRRPDSSPLFCRLLRPGVSDRSSTAHHSRRCSIGRVCRRTAATLVVRTSWSSRTSAWSIREA